MATTAIEFTKTGSDYVCQLTDYQTNMSGVIHLALSEPNQIVAVEVGAAGLPPMVMQTLQTPYGLGVVFGLDIPDGIGVTLRTSKPVTEAVWIS